MSWPAQPARTLRSSDSLLLSVPQMALAFSAKAFSINAPSVCRSAELFSSFRRILKTELFDIAYSGPAFYAACFIQCSPIIVLNIFLKKIIGHVNAAMHHSPPPPVLKGHFSSDRSSANILNIIRLPSVRQHASLVRWWRMVLCKFVLIVWLIDYLPPDWIGLSSCSVYYLCILGAVYI